MRRNALFAACAASALVAAPALAADPTNATVQVSTVTGDRTLSLLSLSGTPLTAASTIETGPGKTGAFLTAVTDTNYNRAGFQVSSTLSNLTHATDPAAEIPSSAVDVTVPANPLDITNVSRVVTPVFTITGNLTGAVLGLVPGFDLTTATTTVQGLPQAVAGDAAHILDGTLATLPIGITKGAGGTFTTPTTAVTLMTGNAPSGTPHADILARLQSTVGTSSTAALVTAGYLDASSVMTAVSNLLSVPVSMLDEAAVLAQLNGTVTDLTGAIVRQSGVYTSNQALRIAIPATAKTGDYRGTLTVTLADVP